MVCFRDPVGALHSALPRALSFREAYLKPRRRVDPFPTPAHDPARCIGARRKTHFERALEVTSGRRRTRCGSAGNYLRHATS